MKRYLIFDENYSLMGHVHGKDEYAQFMKYRNPERYRIEKVGGKTFEKMKENIKGSFSYREPSPIVKDVLLFPEEEEYLFQRLDGLVVDTDAILDKLITEIFPMIRWESKEQRKIVIAYLAEVYEAVKHIEDIDSEPENSYQSFDFARMIIQEMEEGFR